MKVQLLILFVFLCLLQAVCAQEGDGVVALNLPIRNSLTFNRYLINPTFSFVREQTKFISITNKREWVQFNDAPQSYIANYGGRFKENIGAGLSLFQQNYGVLTTFGGVLNFAYNVQVSRGSNLTFGLNVGAYQSGINTSNVVVNFEDPALQNVPQNFLLTVNPGINFGTEFFDFGVAVNNLALYNFESSELLQDNPEQGIQAHVMYTGYMQSRGFFDNSKFSGLLRSEFYKDETILSGIAMLTVPKGIWAQVGYNSVFGASAGVGLNITEHIAAEYNYERAIGDLSAFGPSHEITLAYRFSPNRRLRYSNDDEVAGLISTDKRRGYRRRANTSKTSRTAQKSTPQPNSQKVEPKKVSVAAANTEAEAKAAEELKRAQAAQEKAKQEAEAKAQAEARQKAEAQAQAEAQRLAEEKARQEAEAKAQAEVQRLAEEKARQEAEAKAQAEAQRLAEEKARQEAEAKAQAEAQRLAEEKARKDAEAKALAAAELQQDSTTKKDSIVVDVATLIEESSDERTKQMLNIETETKASSVEQASLLRELDSMVMVKDADLKALKQENDLSEQGIAVQPRPFKSITAENQRLQAIQTDLDALIESRSQKIEELEELYEETIIGDTLTNDVVLLYYKKEIRRLKSEQLKALDTKARLESQLKDIRVATEFERRRRIKRAAFDNEEERYRQDRAALKNIKETTTVSNSGVSINEFDFGEELGNNIKILKNISNTPDGYYLILAVHSDVEKRNEFVTKVVASGNKNIDFFYDVNTSKYYIYSKKVNDINNARQELNTRGNQPYNSKMSIVKIEN
ncbi:type IX secretion system membrane protein PorP/SprF [uncultured Winogradskyella sp.]|uniref:PorP/SprF family type IX secretion system membrane protein n=1 Tax=uncultured Winogradskyella sp. TaxID=395353 RepID=UPI003510F2AF